MAKVVYPASATVNRLAVAADAGVQLKYRLSRPIVLKIGYAALWLAGVALAPAQVQETYTSASCVCALGVNTSKNVFFQGVTFGLDYSF